MEPDGDSPKRRTQRGRRKPLYIRRKAQKELEKAAAVSKPALHWEVAPTNWPASALPYSCVDKLAADRQQVERDDDLPKRHTQGGRWKPELLCREALGELEKVIAEFDEPTVLWDATPTNSPRYTSAYSCWSNVETLPATVPIRIQCVSLSSGFPSMDQPKAHVASEMTPPALSLPCSSALQIDYTFPAYRTTWHPR